MNATKRQFKTLGQVLDEIATQHHLSGLNDMTCRFDGRKYSLLNLRNYLAAWHNSPAYLTESKNIKFLPVGSGGIPRAAMIELEIGTKEKE